MEMPNEQRNGFHLNCHKVNKFSPIELIALVAVVGGRMESNNE